MSIEKRSDLFREYARVIDMCEGTGVDPYECVGCGMSLCDDEPTFMSDPGNYTFAVAILEGRPVFAGDEVYLKDGRKYDWNAVWTCQIVHYLTWNKPKRTFKLAGRELSLPDSKTDGLHGYTAWVPYYFKDSDNRLELERCLSEIITEAIENERLQNK